MVFKNALLLSAVPYSMTDEKTGEVNEGVSVLFMPDILEKSNSTNGSKGSKPLKCSLPIDKMSLFPKAPAIYDVDYDIGANGSGKPVFIYNDFKFVSGCELKPVGK